MSRPSGAVSVLTTGPILPAARDPGVGDGFGVGGEQVDGHVGDPALPRIGLCAQPFGDTRGGPGIDVGQQPGAAGRLDDAGATGRARSASGR